MASQRRCSSINATTLPQYTHVGFLWNWKNDGQETGTAKCPRYDSESDDSLHVLLQFSAKAGSDEIWNRHIAKCSLIVDSSLVVSGGQLVVLSCHTCSRLVHRVAHAQPTSTPSRAHLGVVGHLFRVHVTDSGPTVTRYSVGPSMDRGHGNITRPLYHTNHCHDFAPT